MQFLTGVSFDAEDLFEASVRQNSEQSLGRQADSVLLFKGYGSVHPDSSILARVHDPCRARQKQTRRQELKDPSVSLCGEKNQT